METAEKLDFIKNWLGTGSINIFGLPMSGKDTVGRRLAELLDAKFLGSGDIVRAYEAEHHTDLTGGGKLWPKDLYFKVILPYFYHQDLAGLPLVLSSMGRWSGEENEILKTAADSQHTIKAVLELDFSEADARSRWQAAKELADRGARTDDVDATVFETRLAEFRDKTLPVLEHYQTLGLLIKTPALGTREEVLDHAITALYDYAVLHPELSNEEVKTI